MARILALDLGSTQLKLLVMDEGTNVLYVDTQGYATQTPRAGWLEQRPADWCAALRRGMQKLNEHFGICALDAISFSGHMSGVVLISAQGEPLYPCIMLADSRSETQCAALREKAGDIICAHTGNPVLNAFSLPKLQWLKEQQPECWRKAAAWLSPKDYLRFCLTGKAATEYTDAYNSLCIDRDTANWCDEILCATGLEKEKFPRVLRPFDKAGVVTHEAAQRFGLPEGTPVFAGGADMACGAVGMGLYSEGDSTLTLGTCATFLALVPGESAQCFGQVTYHLHASPGKLYALGSHINGGFAVNWLTRALSETGALDFSMMDALAAEAQGLPVGSNGVLTLPFLAGSGSPYFNARDRQTVLGCSAATTRAELFRSELEGITLNIKQTKEAFSTLVQGGLRRVLLGGGGSKISVWPQIVADVFGMQIELVSNADASAVGAAILGGFGADIFTEIEATARRCLKIKRTLAYDKTAHAQYAEIYQKYLRAYKITNEFYEQES